MSYFNLIKLDATSSTNDYIKQRRLNGNCKAGDLVWTTHQIAGRGQGNKKWVAEAGKSLSMSVYRSFEYFPSTQAFALNTAFSTAIVGALKKLGIAQIKIKWPNDILSGDFKIGGILIENTLKNDQLVNSIMGFGLNINQANFLNLPNAASLYMRTNKKWNIDKVLESLYFSFEKDSFIEVLAHAEENLMTYNKNLWRKGEITKFKNLNQSFQAKVMGVTKKGKLTISDSEGTETDIALSEARMTYPVE